MTISTGQLIREYLNDIPGASPRGVEDAYQKIIHLICDDCGQKRPTLCEQCSARRDISSNWQL